MQALYKENRKDNTSINALIIERKKYHGYNYKSTNQVL